LKSALNAPELGMRNAHGTANLFQSILTPSASPSFFAPLPKEMWSEKRGFRTIGLLFAGIFHHVRSMHH
jgi:hypothetical protein